jgi:DNA-binding response OmpR family regulator
MAATILVVEDDPAVSLALEVALKGEGYTAIRALRLALRRHQICSSLMSASPELMGLSCCVDSAREAQRHP